MIPLMAEVAAGLKVRMWVDLVTKLDLASLCFINSFLEIRFLVSLLNKKMSRNGYREVAAIANCLLCDTYFMLVVGVAPRAAELRGRKGTKILEDHLSKVSTHIYILKVLKSVQKSGIYLFSPYSASYCAC